MEKLATKGDPKAKLPHLGEQASPTEAPPVQRANLFELKGGSTEVVYSTTSIAGVPMLSYKNADTTRSFRGDEIRAEEAGAGGMVTITLHVVPDLSTLTLTILVPVVNVSGNGAQVETVGIVTTHRTTIAGPNLVRGQVESYETIALRGQARCVIF